MLLAMGYGDKDVQEILLNFLPFPSKSRPVFSFWTSSILGIFLFPPGLFANQITGSCPIPKGDPRGASISLPPPGGGQLLAGRLRPAGAAGLTPTPPTPAPPSLPAALLFSLAQATGCDACFLLLMQTQGRGPKGMVGFA